MGDFSLHINQPDYVRISNSLVVVLPLDLNLGAINVVDMDIGRG
jgi:hypothetical protein